MPTINLTDDELPQVTAAIRRAIEEDRWLGSACERSPLARRAETSNRRGPSNRRTRPLARCWGSDQTLPFVFDVFPVAECVELVDRAASVRIFLAQERKD